MERQGEPRKRLPAATRREMIVEAAREVFQESGKPLEYLPLLEQQPSRWAFEAQVAFLASKAHALQRHDPSADLIVDRPERLAELIEADLARWKKLVADAGLTLD